MHTVRTHSKGQIVIPKDIRDSLGIKPGKEVSVELVDDHVEIRPLPEDPIEFLTGIFKDHPVSMSADLLKGRKRDDKIDEKDSF